MSEDSSIFAAAPQRWHHYPSSTSDHQPLDSPRSTGPCCRKGWGPLPSSTPVDTDTGTKFAMESSGVSFSVLQLFSGLLSCILTQHHLFLNGEGLGLLVQRSLPLVQNTLGKALRLTQKATVRSPRLPFFLIITNCLLSHPFCLDSVP